MVCAAPFIRPRDVLRSRAGQDADDKTRRAASRHHPALSRPVSTRAGPPRALSLAPIIATGHLTTVGASASESVREIYVGALGFSTQAFPPVDYLALGHIHRPQCVGGLNHSLQRLAAGAEALTKPTPTNKCGCWTLPRVTSEVSALPVPCAQALASLSGDLASLPAQLAAVAAQGSAERPVAGSARARR